MHVHPDPQPHCSTRTNLEGKCDHRACCRAPSCSRTQCTQHTRVTAGTSLQKQRGRCSANNNKCVHVQQQVRTYTSASLEKVSEYLTIR